MKALIVSLKLEGPLLLTRMGNGDENSSVTLPYIPGGTLRGALVGRYHSVEADLLQDEMAVRLFFSDQVFYLNAYPAAGSRRALPTPASWRKEKGVDLEAKPEARDFAVASKDDFDEALKQPFCIPEDSQSRFILLKPDETLTTHIGGEERGRVTKENDVFQYQALAEGQVFIAAILTADENDHGIIKTLLAQNPILYLGRSRSARYGRVRIVELQEREHWQEATTEEADGKTIITLLSDTLLRDEYGQPTHDLDRWLALRLGKDTLKSEKRFIKPVLVGGFNRKWGLPLPQLPALGMGSVFVYDADELSPQDLVPLIESGIGERRVEGFGRIAVNWQYQEKFYIESAKRGEPPIFSNLTKSSQKLARRMTDRILRQRLDVQISEAAQKLLISGSINNHQLARLRSVLRDTINAGGQDTKPVTDFLNNLKSTAREQYRRARVNSRPGTNGDRLITWLEARLRQKDGLSFVSIRIPEVAGQKADLTEAIKTEYTLRLIEAVIDKKMKDNRRGDR